jgi:hypothetical protein
MRAIKKDLLGVSAAILIACSGAVAQPAPAEPSKSIGPVISGGSSAIALPNPTGEPSNPLAGRGGELPAVIRYVISEGVKITSLGETAGLRTYLGEAANGRFNAFYVAPDGEHLIAGLLFQSGGHNVTNDQIAAMLKRFGEAAKQMPGIDAGLLPSVPESDPKADPKGEFIDWMKSLGMKITPFEGTDGGVQGYLVEAPAEGGAPGKIQAMYVTPDRKHAVAGVLVKRGGMMMTGVQVGRLQQRFLEEEQARQNGLSSPVEPGRMLPRAEPVSPEVAKSLTQKANPASSTIDTKSAPATTAPVQVGAGLRTDGPAETPVPAGVPTPVPYVHQISSKPASASDQYRYPGQDVAAFMEAMKTTVFFTVGVKDRPAIWMLADPQCPFCHQAWAKLKPLVFDGKIQVRVIMIAGLRNSEPLTRSILGRAEPAKAWLAGEGSIDNVPVQPGPAVGSPESERAGEYIRINNGFAARYMIRSTPFLAYTTPDGKLFSSVGLPPDMDAFLAALR